MMKYELIITEKPSAAKKIAEALDNGKPVKENNKGVPYYKVTHKDKDILVGCAVGHLYSVAEKNKGKWTYPVYDIEWQPAGKARKDSGHSTKYLATLKKLAKEADEFTVASVDYDEITPVLENNKLKLVKIGKFVDDVIEKKKNISNFKVPSFDSSGKIKFRKLTNAIRHQINEDLYELSLEYGRKVKLTATHNIFTQDNNKIKNIETTSLKKGDSIFCPNKLPPLKEYKEVNLLELHNVNKKRELFVSGKDVSKILKKRVMDKKRKESPLNDKRIILTQEGLLKIKEQRTELGYSTSQAAKKAKLSQPTIVMWENGKRNPTDNTFRQYLATIKITSDFITNKKYCKIKDSSFKNLLNTIYTTQFKEFSDLSRSTISLDKLSKTEINNIKTGLIYGSKNRNNSLPIKLKIDKEFVRLLGYYLAEGDVNNNYRLRFSLGLVNYGHEHIIIKEIQEFCSKYNISSHHYLHKKIKHQIVTIDNSVLACLFNEILNFGSRANNKRLPSIVFHLSPNLKQEFLRSYFLGDGTLSKNEVKFNTASEYLATDISYILLQLGIISSISKVKCKTSKSKGYMWRVSITNSKDLQKIRKIWRSHHKSELIKLTSRDMKKRNITKFNDISLIKIKDIKKIKSSNKYVYDLSVEGENFIAGQGGVCCHNTDYDIEGEVIGLNVIRFACKQKDANRMKFSTLTKPDIVKAYENKQKHIDWGQANAGETRHFLDWIYGINLSRALSIAVKKAMNRHQILSAGRVQGPALKTIVDKEKEILAFIPEPFWQIELNGKVKNGEIIAWHKEDKFWEKPKAEAVMKTVKDKNGKITDISKKSFQQAPPHPFDLTTLQTEAYRTLGIQPKITLSMAQTLYTEGYISYPRTSSQKLPKELGLNKIIKQLARQDKFVKECNFLLKKKDLKPNEGKKSDPAHPAIYPTGIAPKLSGKEGDLYELITRRFLATFGDAATRETQKITVDVEKEDFIAKGTITTEKGWHELYGRFAMMKEEELPEVEKGEDVDVKKIVMHDKETQPPKRYTPASIIKELEKRGLGTKATRAQIVDNLFQRGYVTGKSIEATKLGIKTVETLEKHAPKIVDEEMTRNIELEMEEIRQGTKNEEQVLEAAKKSLGIVLDDFKKHEKEIGSELGEARAITEKELSTIGKCPKCKDGTLVIKRGKFGQFIACDKYPDCKTTFGLPTGVRFKVADKPCEACTYPVLTLLKKKGVQNVCLNPECPTKKIEDSALQKEAEQIDSGKVTKPCPKCEKGHLVLRKSLYGSFYGCSNYPKCKHTEKIEDNGEEKSSEKPAVKKKAAKKKKTVKKT